MKISVIGLGKAGLPLAAVIADSGIKVLGVDLDKKRVEKINKGINPIPEEKGLKEILKKNAGKNLIATTDAVMAAKKSNVHIIIVPLFIDEKTKKPDFSVIKKALQNISRGLKEGDLVVLETTVPVGTTKTLLQKTLEENSGKIAGKDFYLAYSPERIMTGYSVSRFREFPKVVGGIDEESTKKAYEVYKKFANPIKVKNERTAELIKISEGIYRDINIAIANELFKISEKYDVDFWELRSAAKHEFCNILEPGNVGGHCIPVYPWFIINDNDVPLIKTARELNDDMIKYYAKKAEKKAKENNGNKIGIIGLSYREGVKEKAYSRSVPLIKILKEENYEVFGFDPLYSESETKEEFDISYINPENFNDMSAIILMNKEKGTIIDKLIPIKEKVVDIKNQLK